MHMADPIDAALAAAALAPVEVHTTTAGVTQQSLANLIAYDKYRIAKCISRRGQPGRRSPLAGLIIGRAKPPGAVGPCSPGTREEDPSMDPTY
jgi:hypothetical protein